MKSVPITQIASDNQVSRKYVYKQSDLVEKALNETFAPATNDNDVLFYLPITKAWIFQLILSLVLICHCSYRGVVELFRDVFDISISIGTVHNRLKSVASNAAKINQSQDLSRVKVGLQDEIFQGPQPVLSGVDAFSTYCYLLKAVVHRDEDTWGCHLLDLEAQGFKPDYTIADGGKGLRAGQKAALPNTPCHGDVFHILQQFEELSNSLTRQAQGATTQRLKLEEKMAKARLVNKVSRPMIGVVIS